MKHLQVTILMVLSYLNLYSQDTVVWNYPQNKPIEETPFFTERIVLKVTNIHPNDSIFFESEKRKITCVDQQQTVYLNIKKIIEVDSVQIIYCNDSIKLKLENRAIQLFNQNEIQFITLKSGPDIKTHAPGKRRFSDLEIGKIRNVYNDALILLTRDNVDRIKVFYKYNINSATETNSFLEGLQKMTFSDTSSVNEANLHSLRLEGAKANQNVLSNIAGLNVTNYVDGLAKFLVSRVKQELTILYFDNFSKAIGDTSLKDIQVLFKNTSGQLQLLGERIYDFKSYLNSIRDGMENDYKLLPESFHSLLKDEESQVSRAIYTRKNARFTISTALELTKAIKDKEHIGIALANLEPESYKNTDTTLTGIVQTLQLFSDAFRDSITTKDADYWVDRNKINTLIQTDTFLMYFIGLVTHIAKLKNIQFSQEISLFQILNDSIGPKKIKIFKSFINTLKSSFGKIQDIHQQYKTNSDNDLRGGLIADYFDAANSLIASSREFIDLFNLKNSKPQLLCMLDVFNDVNGMVKNVSVKKYSLTTTHLGHLLKNLNVPGDKFQWQKTVSFITEKAQFIGQMAEAKSSSEVDSLLQIYAAPIGSWRDKRVARFNVALDSYIGPAAFLSDGESRMTLSTPVGPSVTFGGKKYQITALMSLIDIGPITSFRFKNDTSEVSKISLNEIISPGFLVSFQLGKKFPFSFNLGYQEYPLLKKVSYGTNDFNVKRAPGLTVSFNFNIPILTLANKKMESEEPRQ